MTDDTETVNPASLASIPIQTLRDSRLSLEGLGLLCRLLSRPNNCQVQMGNLRLELGIGQDKLRNLLAELSRAGYLQREKRHGAGGRWGWKSTVWSESQKSPIR
ncbi:hypothetical protein [Acidithiobacillus ferridurans]|jgi:hypothetical protein|uniref:Uncharacterized protein n=2 Tax=Acidithiobacillus ferridurans TaxID=1232575 RepID=A0A2Z6IM18_ACIFI|nr:hypothetical protein [Acidithiobacillus ferridurans]MBU2717723.1 hypothetical protein [Acidithiobacillus ferridurans]MBU2723203.1 hypothetical protein [Acidithiobacillus ferridurans]MBU2725569.1 hypothetical protein [Acidithiobacillus ferridurans]BBF66476.1 hypothetical protein AFERRID_26940 [Acidithiobacillus ferridurans]